MASADKTTDAATLGEVGELATLARILPRLPGSRHEQVGPGDDAAVLAAPDGRYVVTTDMMIAGPDFRSAWSTPEDLGWKAAATNLSDVAAMGAMPTALVIALAAPETTPVSHLEEIADGFRLACQHLASGCGVAGGDLSVSSVLTIAVTAFGDLEGRTPVLRSGARPGDVIAYAGSLGEAGRGLSLLFEHAVDDAGHPDRARAAQVRAEHPRFVEAQLRPDPPIHAGVIAARGGATAMLDVSDGLALDARRLAEASDVRLDLSSAALGDDPDASLGGGEDHGLLATFPPEIELPQPFHRLGSVIGPGPDPRVLVDSIPWHGHEGWDPYRTAHR